MRIDAHQHFLAAASSPAEYPWIGEGMESLRRDLLPADIEPLLRDAGVDGTVAVQARQTLGETRWLLDLAARCKAVRGVIGWVDLRRPEAAAQIEGFTASPRLRGVRHVVHHEPDPEFLLGADFLRGLSLLPGYGLTYDLLVFPLHLEAACRVADLLPGLRFVLDHIGKPPIRKGALEPWRTGIRRLAARPNVACKVSGMVTEADWKAWKPSDFEPYFDVVLEAFGPKRLMIGSDWPVCTLAGSYGRVMDLVSGLLARLSDAERELVQAGTAVEWYGLEGHGSSG